MPITPTDWVAIIGAAAWLPQITTWVWKIASRPKIRLIHSPVSEVGYNTKGPVLNINGALSATVKDAVIERMTALIRHENGQELFLTWAYVSQTFSQVRSTTGDTAEYHRSQPAVALKVSTQLLTESLLGFQDLKFQETQRTLANALLDRLLQLRRTEEDSAAAGLHSKELDDYLDFFTRAFPWRAGTYTIRLEIFLTESKGPTVQEFTFVLTKTEEERLRQNIAEIARVTKDFVANTPVDQRGTDSWLWANPTLSRRALLQLRDRK